MGQFSFRLRFILAPRDAVGLSESSTVLPPPQEGVSLELRAAAPGEMISDAKNLVIVGREWESESAALEVGARVKSAVMLALAALRMGCDFGDREGGSFFTESGLKMLEAHAGRRFLHDVHGLMAFEAGPPPLFAEAMDMSWVRTMPPERFFDVLGKAFAINYTPTTAEALAFELYNASFFEKTERTRFLVLVMAVEALLKPKKRRPEARTHVEDLLQRTTDSVSLTDEEKASIAGSLGYLRKDSISQTGRELAAARLSGRKYMDLLAAEFFDHCYTLRSNIVHGRGVRGDDPVIGSTAAPLETFVADLLAGFRIGFDA